MTIYSKTEQITFTDRGQSPIHQITVQYNDVLSRYTRSVSILQSINYKFLLSIANVSDDKSFWTSWIFQLWGKINRAGKSLSLCWLIRLPFHIGERWVGMFRLFFVLALALSSFAKSQNKSTSQVIKLITWFKEIVFASKFEWKHENFAFCLTCDFLNNP